MLDLMKKVAAVVPLEGDEHLQIQVPASTKRHLGILSIENRAPIRVIVLRALKAYGVSVPKEAIFDRRGRRRAS